MILEKREYLDGRITLYRHALVHRKSATTCKRIEFAIEHGVIEG